MDQTLYAQAANVDFLNGGLETKLDSVMVSGPSETELQYYRTFFTLPPRAKAGVLNWNPR